MTILSLDLPALWLNGGFHCLICRGSGGSYATCRRALGCLVRVGLQPGDQSLQVGDRQVVLDDDQVRVGRDQGHGLFTYFFLKGIQGSADANGDRSVSAAELETYVKSNVRSYATERMSGAAQSPEVFTNNPGRPVVTVK